MRAQLTDARRAALHRRVRLVVDVASPCEVLEEMQHDQTEEKEIA